MNNLEFKEHVKGLSVGKKLPDAIYIHKSALVDISFPLRNLVQSAVEKSELAPQDWDIVKFFRKDYRLSLLSYPHFMSDSYPQLRCSYTIRLADQSIIKRDYSKSPNPPILHRKETFLLKSHPQSIPFAELTKEGEAAGLYENSKRIGFFKQWQQVIADKGYELVQGRLVAKKKVKPKKIKSVIDRYKTAIDRNRLSAPMQALYKHGFFDQQPTVLDYGCGKGDDLRILEQNNIDVVGYDPVYFPHTKVRRSEVVNLGFVLNVIENKEERQDTLQKAFALTEKVLAVSVMLGGDKLIEKFTAYADGVLTSRNTFQKYYSQNEFRDFIKDSLSLTPIAVAPGIFYIFKDERAEQDFLVNRQSHRKNWQKLSYREHPERLKIKQKALFTRHQELFNLFWEKCLDFGRLPSNEEFNGSEKLRNICGSLQKALTLVIAVNGEKSFKQAGARRRNDLLVYYALGLFSKKKPYKNMPKRLQKDIKYFFINYSSAIKEATELLFSVGKPVVINTHCENAFQQLGRGTLENNHSLILHVNDIGLLPAPLRVYVGCATQLYGDIESVDLIKIHIRSGKVSMMKYDDFDNKDIPLLIVRAKVKLREQTIDFFEYGEEYAPAPLLNKTDYI